MPQGGGSNEQTTRTLKDTLAAGNETERREAAADTGTPPGEPAVTAAELEGKLAELEAQIAQLKEDRLRALAEVENVRRRAARDRQDASQYAISNFARDLLSVADNLQRALVSVDASARAGDPALDALMNGVDMTERELLAVLERYDVKAIEAEGQPFDPHVHEAMFEIPNEAVPHGTVLQVLQRGYLLHDRTLRPARVGISRGGPKVPVGTATPATEAPAASAAEPAADEPAQPDAETGKPRGERIEDIPTDTGAEPEASTSTGEKIIDFLKRAAGDAYPKQQGGEPRSGSRVDEKL